MKSKLLSFENKKYFPVKRIPLVLSRKSLVCSEDVLGVDPLSHCGGVNKKVEIKPCLLLFFNTL